MRFVILTEGPTPREARPVLATSDPVVVAAVCSALGQRLRQFEGDNAERQK